MNLYESFGSATNRPRARLVSSVDAREHASLGGDENANEDIVYAPACSLGSDVAGELRNGIGKAGPARTTAPSCRQKMTLDEKLTLVLGYFGSDWQGKKPPAEAATVRQATFPGSRALASRPNMKPTPASESLPRAEPQ